jgi:hypothetical protein
MTRLPGPASLTLTWFGFMRSHLPFVVLAELLVAVPLWFAGTAAHAASKIARAPVAIMRPSSRAPVKPPSKAVPSPVSAKPTLDAKPNDAKPNDAKPNDAKPNDAKPKTEGRCNIKAASKVAAVPGARGRVAVFGFRGEGAAPVHAQVVRVLRKRGFDVTTTLRPVDSPDQYRDMAALLGLAVYVDGDVIDDGARASALVRIRSGVTGFRIASARFSGNSDRLPADVARGLWPEVGAAFARACAHASSRPRRTERAPLRIEAGTPIENTPSGTEGT